MKQNIPAAARDALARQTAADEHPSADLLSGFVEQVLAPAEKDSVATHLAACSDCREIVFLASASGEAPAAASAKLGHGFQPTRRWASWKWALPAMAALAIVAGVVLHGTFQPARKTTVAANRPPEMHAGTTIPENEKPSSSQSAPAYSYEAKSALAEPAPAVSREAARKKALMGQPKAAESAHQDVASGSLPSTSVAAQSSASADAAAQPAAGANVVAQAVPPAPASRAREVRPAGSADIPAAKGISNAPAAVAKAATAGQSTFGSPERDNMGGLKSLAVKDRAALQARWRITDVGELERSIVAGNWTRVLAEQQVSFRAVAVIGNQVWAGGSGGALFHSTDAGNAWSKVMLITEGQHEPGAVVSIHFNTAVQGKVTTDSGTTWSTSDGGQTWSKQ